MVWFALLGGENEVIRWHAAWLGSYEASRWPLLLVPVPRPIDRELLPRESGVSERMLRR
jgi:hypothetical protein